VRAAFQLCVLAACLSTFTMSYAQTNDEMPLPPILDNDFEGRLISEPTWVMPRPTQIDVDYRGSASRDYIAETQKLELLGLGNQKLSLICQTNTFTRRNRVTSVLSAAIDLDRRATKSVEPLQTASTKILRKKTIVIADKTISTYFVLAQNRLNIVFMERSTPRKIFNAAVKGQDVSLNLDGLPAFQTTLPKPNQDFKNFVKVCPAVQPKKK